MKKTLITLVIIISNVTYAQNIGINSTGAAPAASAMLDIDAAPGNNKGLLVPRIPLIATTNAAPVTAPATSLMVYNTATAGSGSTAVVPGYYYWDGSKWVKLTTSAWETNGNAGTIAGTHFIGTTDAQDVVVKTNNIERARILSAGNFGIGTIAPVEKLHVNGNILANDGIYPQASYNVGYSSSTVISDIFEPWTDNGIKIYDANSLSHLHLEAVGHCVIQAYGTAGAPKSSLENTAYSSLILQDRGGNVGIGNITPGNKLEITSATANTSGLRFTNLTAASPTVASNGKALSVDVNGDVVLMPSAADAWQLLGNAGTTAGTNFIGTTDNQDIVLKRNNVQSGLINAALQNTSFGLGALNPATTGFLNTAIGYQSLIANTTGVQNTAIGDQCLHNNTTGSQNTANGDASLGVNTTGNNNTATGVSSLGGNNTGNNNTGNGVNSLQLNQADNNTAMGFNSLYFNTTGNNNTAIGSIAGTGGGANTTGSNNTFLGFAADVTVNNLTNATAIGYNAKVAESNALILGGTGSDAVKVGIGTVSPQRALHLHSPNNNFHAIQLTAENQTDWWDIVRRGQTYGDPDAFVISHNGVVNFEISSVGNVGIALASIPAFKLEVNGTTACTGNVWTSDRRKKQNIQPLKANALEIVNKLNPVTYEWKDVKDDGMKGPQMGFIAQELEQILPTMVVTTNNEEQSKGVKYNELLPILVKAIQEQNKKIEELENKIELLKSNK